MHACGVQRNSGDQNPEFCQTGCEQRVRQDVQCAGPRMIGVPRGGKNLTRGTPQLQSDNLDVAE